MECPDAAGQACPDPEACQQGAPCSLVWRHNMDDTTDITTAGSINPINVNINPEHERIKLLLEEWWRDQSYEEMSACVPKAAEYGSTDLAVIGRAMARMMGRNGDVSHEEATEIGIFFYLQGKIARWEDALRHGRRVSDDTLHDIAVYTKMQQRNRAVGGWPIAPDKEAGI